MSISLIIGIVLVFAAFLCVVVFIDPAEMDERHAAYVDGYWTGYKGQHPGFLMGPHVAAFKAGYEAGANKRYKDACRG